MAAACFVLLLTFKDEKSRSAAVRCMCVFLLFVVHVGTHANVGHLSCKSGCRQRRKFSAPVAQCAAGLFLSSTIHAQVTCKTRAW